MENTEQNYSRENFRTIKLGWKSALAGICFATLLGLGEEYQRKMLDNITQEIKEYKIENAILESQNSQLRGVIERIQLGIPFIQEQLPIRI